MRTVLTMPAVKDKDQLVLLRVKIEATPIYCLLKSGQCFEYRHTRLQRVRELVSQHKNQCSIHVHVP